MYKVKLLVAIEMEIPRAGDEGDAVILANNQIGFQLENLYASCKMIEGQAEYIPTWKYADNFFKEGAKK